MSSGVIGMRLFLLIAWDTKRGANNDLGYSNVNTNQIW